MEVVTEEKVIEEQGELRKGEGCLDQIFVIKIIVEEYLKKVKRCMQPSWT